MGESKRRKAAGQGPRQPTGRGWTEDDVHRMLTNPVVVGIGPFPPFSDTAETLWYDVQTEMVRREGAARTLAGIREELLRTFIDGVEMVSGETWLADMERAIGIEGVQPVLRRLIADLRRELAGVPADRVRPAYGYSQQPTAS